VSTFTLNIGKYRNILISIGLFLLLDASVLMLNFYISYEIADDAASINLAGRQRMLSQRMTKSLVDLGYADNTSKTQQHSIDELRLSRNVFDSTLSAFADGGTATDAQGNPVMLKRASDPESRRALTSAQTIWMQYRTQIDAVLQLSSTPVVFSDTRYQRTIDEAIRFGRANNLALLKLMNDLTVSLESVAASKAQRLRLIQTAGIFMALINFFIILFHFIGQLQKGDKVLEAARKETTEILQTVNEGLFLVHSDLSIGSQCSKELDKIFNLASYEGVNFKDLLKDIISEKDLETAHGFVRLLFNEKVKEKLIKDLNPLDHIQVNIDDGKGAYVTKYLSFDFKRVMQGHDIVDVLVVVNDITETIKLEEALDEAKAQNEKQIAMLTHILQANPAQLKLFLNNAYRCFSDINQLLKQPAKKQSQFKEKIHTIFTEVHRFKGDASALELTDFAAMAHKFESELAEMKDRNGLRGQDFLGLTVHLNQMISHTQAITHLMKKLSDFGADPAATKNSHQAPGNSWQHLTRLVSDIAGRYKKKAILVTSGLNEIYLSEELHNTINSVCVQFIRNAIVHGIESPDERESLQKDECGRIDIRLAECGDGTLELVIRDDGAGFDYQKIREHALNTGEWSEQEIEGWDNKQLLSLIFTPGFTTADQLTEDAGRGVGMGVIMQKIKAHNGRIIVSNCHNRYSRFVICFPREAIAKAA